MASSLPRRLCCCDEVAASETRSEISEQRLQTRCIHRMDVR